MPGASNLVILMFLTWFFHLCIPKVAAHNFIKNRSADGLAAKGLLQYPEMKPHPHSYGSSVLIELEFGVLALRTEEH